MPDSHTFDAPYLTRLTRDILHAAGTPTEMAAEVARILVNPNLTGHDSHGRCGVSPSCRRVEGGGLRAVSTALRFSGLRVVGSFGRS